MVKANNGIFGGAAAEGASEANAKAVGACPGSAVCPRWRSLSEALALAPGRA